MAFWDGVLVEDGAMGTMLAAAGALAAGQAPFEAVLTRPDVVTEVHRAYVEAGARVVMTNTFGATRARLGNAETVNKVNQAAVACARKADARWVAGDIGPIGVLLEPYGDLEESEAFELFAEQAQALATAGCDLFAIETMTDLTEAVLAVKAVQSVSDKPVFATLSFGESGRTFMGTTPAEAATTLAALGVQGVGANCSVGPAGLKPVIEAMAAALQDVASPAPALIAKPNAGMPQTTAQGNVAYELAPDAFAAAMRPLIAAGATVVGGCCGTTPAHIAALAHIVSAP